MGVIRTKTHSNPWSNVAATAYSGLEKSHSRYELPIVASAMRTGAVATPIAMQRGVGRAALGFLRPRDLVVQHLELF